MNYGKLEVNFVKISLDKLHLNNKITELEKSAEKSSNPIIFKSSLN